MHDDVSKVWAARVHEAREREISTRRFSFLRSLSTVFAVEAILVLVGGLLVALAAPTGLIAFLIAVAVCVVVTLLLAIAQAIKVFLAIEQNTREGNNRLSQIAELLERD